MRDNMINLKSTSSFWNTNETELALEQNSVSPFEYRKIKQYMFNILESYAVKCTAEHQPTRNRFIIIMKVVASTDLITQMNTDLSLLMAKDETLSLTLTGSFSTFLPSKEVIFSEY